MSKTNVWENDLLKLVFNNEAVTLIGDAAGLQPSAATGNLYLSMHIADPAEGGDQTSSEAAYTGYARVPVARTTSGFTVVNNTVNLVNDQDFGMCTALPGAPLTHVGIGCSASGTGKLLYKGTLTPSVTMGINVIPRLSNAANLLTED